MEGVSQYQRPVNQNVTVHQPTSPWRTFLPDLLKTAVGGAIMASIKSKLETQPEFENKKELQKSLGEIQKDIERMKETAASQRQSSANTTQQLLHGFRYGADGTLQPPQSGVASGMPDIPGHTWAMVNGVPTPIKNTPTVDVQIPSGVPGVAPQTIRNVTPDVAMTSQAGIIGHGISKATPGGNYTQQQIIDDTAKHYAEQQKGIDTKYGTSNAFGQFSIDEKVRAQWEREREAMLTNKLKDMALISQGQKPSWMTYVPPDPNAAAADAYTTDFIRSFSGGQQ